MGALTIGMLSNNVSIKNIYEFLKKNKGMTEIELIKKDYDDYTYSIKFKYSSTLENGDEIDEFEEFEERDMLISECKDFDSDDIEYWKEKLKVDKDLSDGIYMSLSSYGCSIEIISSILAEFGGGYLIPNDYNEKVLEVNKDNLYDLDLDEHDIAYNH